MKFSIVQMNPTVGALADNAAEILRWYEAGVGDGVDVVVLPEAALTGYPLGDLVLNPSFMDEVERFVRHILDAVAARNKNVALIFGSPTKGELPGELYNSAVVFDPIHGEQITHKQNLSSCVLIEEARHFVAAYEIPSPVMVHGHRIGLMISEDCWTTEVSQSLKAKGAELLLAINASPFEVGKNVTRRQIVEARIRETALPFMYVNMVGGQDELVFDGGSFHYNGTDIVREQAPHFKSGRFFFEYDFNTSSPVTLDDFWHVKSSYGEIYQACVLGLRDYMRKLGFKTAVLGYSGGVDSGLVAAIACDAIGAANVHLVRLPSKFSSDHSLNDAEEGAARLGCPMTTINIEGIVDELRNSYTLAARHYSPSQKIYALTGVADENIQARARGNILMAISNQEGHLLLTTGNKSEVAVGYSTLYGDMAGGFNPIKDCYKTTVWELCRWRNARQAVDIERHGFLGVVGDVVPESIIVKPPSAELRPDQKDEDSLPSYPVLDAILESMIERNMSIKEIVEAGIADTETTTRIRSLVDNSEYKRRQSAPGVKITSKIFSGDRHYPVVNRWRG